MASGSHRFGVRFVEIEQGGRHTGMATVGKCGRGRKDGESHSTADNSPYGEASVLGGGKTREKDWKRRGKLREKGCAGETERAGGRESGRAGDSPAGEQEGNQKPQLARVDVFSCADGRSCCPPAAEPCGRLCGLRPCSPNRR